MATGYVDWDFAAATRRALVPAGPQVTHAEAVAEVEAISAAARRVHDPVAETSRLHTPDDAPDAVVVDRPTWIATNATSMGAMLDPAFEQILAKRGQTAGQGGAVAAFGGKVTGAEAGALLAFMASKVLGQYDIAPGGTPGLLLVAPNLMQTQRELKVDPADFRTWVCMHEETHRVQFTAVPWLREHIINQAQGLVSDLVPDQARVREITTRLGENLPKVFGGDSAGLTELVASPEQRAKLAEITAVMSLLEGHADVVMDDVGPAHIPSVAEIRSKFTERRKGGGVLDVMLRRLLGLEAKMRQYRDGAAFVRGVQDVVGVDGFNAVWTSPDTLPRAVEITDPAAWVARVHG